MVCCQPCQGVGEAVLVRVRRRSRGLLLPGSRAQGLAVCPGGRKERCEAPGAVCLGDMEDWWSLAEPLGSQEKAAARPGGGRGEEPLLCQGPFGYL